MPKPLYPGESWERAATRERLAASREHAAQRERVEALAEQRRQAKAASASPRPDDPAPTPPPAPTEPPKRRTWRDLGPDGIRVMCIAPGRTMTERATAGGLDPAYVEQTLARQAVKQLVQPDDIARLALWLASDDARIMSGQTIIADGGHMLR